MTFENKFIIKHNQKGKVYAHLVYKYLGDRVLFDVSKEVCKLMKSYNCDAYRAISILISGKNA